MAVGTYILLRFTMNYFIDSYYVTEEQKEERRAEYIADLQSFADEEGLSSADTDKLALWAGDNPYLYILIYKNDELFFSSDMNENADGGPGSSGGSFSGSDGESLNPLPPGYDFGSLGIVNKVDREELIKQAEASGMHEISLSDGPIFAAVAEYSEELYYNLANIMSLAVGMLMLAVVLILYFRRIVIRIKRLESDVNIVSHVNMNHKIVCEGEDEISLLSMNVENMRNSILENLEKEREARDANTELVTAMSHDIRTPLTVLLGYIDMLKSYEGCDDTVKSYVTATERTALRLKELSDDMFKYSLAFGNPEEAIELMEYNANMLFDQLLSEHILLLRESGYTVNAEKGMSSIDDGVTVYTDPQNLMRVVDNIFQNIYKYADPAFPVEISSVKSRESISIFVTNRVRREPATAESNRIGLKTCKRLCDLMGGDFSYRDRGGNFTVILKLRLGDSSGENKEISAE